MELPALTVFTKPWPLSLAEVARKVKALGLDGVELPVRPGFPVNPDNARGGLKEAVKIFADHGLRIYSVAADVSEPILQACAEAGVSFVRICVRVPDGESYMGTEEKVRREFAGMIPSLARYGVTVGIQNHCDRWVANAMGIRHLIEEFDPAHFAAVWDAAHAALNGEDPELGLDIVSSHLRMVNLKNAYWQRTSGPEAEEARWLHYWTSGRQGLASWPRVVRELARRQYRLPVCLTAEYSDEKAVDRLIAQDVEFARELFKQEYAQADAAKEETTATAGGNPAPPSTAPVTPR